MVIARCRSAALRTVDVIAVGSRRMSAPRRRLSVMRGYCRRNGHGVYHLVETGSVLAVPRGEEFATASAPAAARCRVHDTGGARAPRTFPA